MRGPTPRPIPKILCAPGFTDARTGSKANATVAALLVVANRLSAIVVADAPAGASDAKAWVGDWGSDADGSRLYAVTPQVSVMGADGNPVSKPASPYVAGVISRVDSELGYWHSPSNKIIHGIIGTSRPIDFSLNDPRGGVQHPERVGALRDYSPRRVSAVGIPKRGVGRAVAIPCRAQNRRHRLSEHRAVLSLGFG